MLKEFVSVLLPEQLGELLRLFGKLKKRSDEELVHDLRVAARRLGLTFSMLGSVGFKAHVLKLEAFCGKVDRIFSPTRNTDVSIMLLDELRKKRGQLMTEAVDYVLARQKKIRKKKFKRASKACKTLNWKAFGSAASRLRGNLKARVGSRGYGNCRAAQSRGERGGRSGEKFERYFLKRIGDLGRGIMRERSALTARSPDEDWHKVRKDLRQIRYALEALNTVTGRSKSAPSRPLGQSPRTQERQRREGRLGALKASEMRDEARREALFRPGRKAIRRLVRLQRLLGVAHDLFMLRRKISRARMKLPPELAGSGPARTGQVLEALERLQEEVKKTKLGNLKEFMKVRLELEVRRFGRLANDLCRSLRRHRYELWMGG